MRIYFYKLTVDDGGAPCVQDGLLSLAICKPMIRSTARLGDLVFGFAANSLRPDNALLYVARITEKVRCAEYYEREEFARRRDCIYERRGDRFTWRRDALYHGPEDVKGDLGRHPDYRKANVLLSNDFRYFGRSASADYKSRFPVVAQAVEGLGQGHRVRHREELRRQLLDLEEQVWARGPNIAGEPTTAPRRGACHRDPVCGVLS